MGNNETNIDEIIPVEPNEEDNDVKVKVGITNHIFSELNSTDKTITLNFEVNFIYEVKELVNKFKLTEDDAVKNFRIPFHIQNALDINIKESWISYSKFKVLREIDKTYYKLPPLDINTSISDDKIFKLEKHNIICELKIINFVSLIPFNKVLIPIKIITNGCPGSDKIEFVPENYNEIMWGVKTEKKLLSNYWLPIGYVLAPHIQTGFQEKSYSRIYFILSYQFSPLIDIIKYYFIPCILTIILTLFYNLEESDFAGLFSTIVLGDIALLFILPATGEITRSEKSVCLNILLVIIITILKLYEINMTRMLGTLIFLSINFLNLTYDIIDAYLKNTKINNLIINNKDLDYQEMTEDEKKEKKNQKLKKKIEDVTKKIDALDYVLTKSNYTIQTKIYK